MLDTFYRNSGPLFFYAKYTVAKSYLHAFYFLSLNYVFVKIWALFLLPEILTVKSFSGLLLYYLFILPFLKGAQSFAYGIPTNFVFIITF